MRACSKCNTPVREHDKFCYKCGTPLSCEITELKSNAVPKDNIDYRSMKLDELMVLADKGDCTAMAHIGAYYLSLDEDLNIDGKKPRCIAMDWLERAAKAGHAGGIPVITSFYEVLVDLRECSGYGTPEVIADKRTLYDWYIRGYDLYKRNAPGSEMIKIDEFIADMENCRFSLAFSLFITDSNGEAASYVNNSKDMPSRLLSALIGYKCRLQEEVDENYFDRVNEAAKPLMDIFDDEYKEKDKTPVEELVCAFVALYISQHWSNFLDNKVMGLDALKIIRDYIKGEKATKMIDEEISRYKKDSSGNLIYT